VGDWGREGNANQRRAADLMARVAACMPPKFVISTGDNFYPREPPPGVMPGGRRLLGGPARGGCCWGGWRPTTENPSLRPARPERRPPPACLPAADGLSGPQDGAFRRSFTDVYSARELQVRRRRGDATSCGPP
jgi:hypothetical protein